jgi:phosphoribosylaminoimidazolecarboxamide formyltransferase/IMP cyclohydrolase
LSDLLVQHHADQQRERVIGQQFVHRVVLAQVQQSRLGCVRLAGAKSDTWWLRRHPRVQALHIGQNPKIQDRINDQIQYLDGGAAGSALPPTPGGTPPLTAVERTQWLSRLDEVSLASDGALPFPDNIVHARRHGVRYVAEPGGSIRSAEVIAACRDQEVALVHTGLRLFRH